ncbi:MAG: alpha/beta fold hydrolase [Planctomycetota bacterium]
MLRFTTSVRPDTRGVAEPRVAELAAIEMVVDVFEPDSDQATGEVAGVVVLLHGLYESRRHPDLSRWRQALVDDGWVTAVPDLRGHGESGGDFFGWGLGDVDDLTPLADELADAFPGRPIVVVGFSYGGLAALHWMARDARVEAAVVIASPADPAETLPVFVARWAGALAWTAPRSWLTAAFRARLDDLGINANQLPAETLAGRFDGRPVLILHGQADRLVPPDHAERWAAAVGPSARVILWPDQRHGTIAWYRGQALADGRAFLRDQAGTASDR